MPGTIYTAAEAIEHAGGKALRGGGRHPRRGGGSRGRRASAGGFGGIDILVNNASAISLTGTPDTPMKRFDLMFGVNVRGTFLCSHRHACLT